MLFPECDLRMEQIYWWVMKRRGTAEQRGGTRSRVLDGFFFRIQLWCTFPRPCGLPRGVGVMVG